MNHIFQVGDTVRVRNGSPPGHIRTPFYVRSCLGVIERVAGGFRNPEELAFGRFNAPTLYRSTESAKNSRMCGRIIVVVLPTC